MVKFNELRVDSKSSKLVIDVSVLDLSYYTDVYIKKVYVHTLDTVNAIDPSSSLDTAIYTSLEYSSETKEVQLNLDGSDRTDGGTDTIDMSATMFFVIVECAGTPSSDTPCGMDNVYSLGVTFDLCPIYNNILPQIKELTNCCSTPQNLINKFLLFKALLITVETNHYQEAINYYKKFFLDLTSNSNSNCGCYGRYNL